MRFHIHVYFDLEYKPYAVGVYEAMSYTFPNINMGKIYDQPIGPHTKPMFQVSITPEMFGVVVPWLMFNRNNLDVLVHPVSGDELNDHTKRVLWLGSPVDLDLDKL